VLTPEWQVAIYDFKHAPEHQRIFCDRIGREKSMTLSLVMFGASIVWLNMAGAVSSPALVFVFTLFYGKGQRLAAPALLRLDQYRER